MRFLAFIFVLLFILLSAQISFAAEVTFSNAPTSIQKDQEITLDVVITGAAKNTINYIRAAFFHPDFSTSYFGYVYNHNSTWYNGTPPPLDPRQYLEVQINEEGSWSGQVKIKADTDSSSFKGNGIYHLKVGRYTASAASVSNWSNSSQVEIQGAVPSPTMTSKPAPTEKPTPSLKITKIPNPQSVTSEEAVPSQVLEDVNVESSSQKQDFNENKSTLVLGVSSVPGPSISIGQSVKAVSSSKTPAIIFISGAVILIIGCGILLFRAYRKQQLEEL